MSNDKNIIQHACDNIALIDVCDVVADLHGALLAETNIQLPTVINDWDIFNIVSKDESALIKKLFANQEFWRNLPVVRGAKDGVEKIRNAGFHVQWVTSSWHSCNDWENIRRAWLRENFNSEENDMSVTSRKYMVDGAFLIDDRPKHVQQWVSHRPDKTAYLFNTRLNAFFKWEHRFDWSMVDKILNGR